MPNWIIDRNKFDYPAREESLTFVKRQEKEAHREVFFVSGGEYLMHLLGAGMSVLLPSSMHLPFRLQWMPPQFGLINTSHLTRLIYTPTVIFSVVLHPSK